MLQMHLVCEVGLEHGQLQNLRLRDQIRLNISVQMARRFLTP